MVEPTGKKIKKNKKCKQSELKVGRKGRSQGSHLAPEVSFKTGLNWVHSSNNIYRRILNWV